MIARWTGICAKCDTTWETGDQIKSRYKRAGFDKTTGKPVWVRVPKAYVHAPRCPKVTPNKPGQRQVDPLTGEILQAESAPTQQEVLW